MEEKLKTISQTQNAFQVSLLMLGAAALYGLIVLYLAFQSWAWQLLTHAGGMVVFCLMTTVGAVVIRRGHTVLGIGLMLGGLYVAGLSATLTIANFGMTVAFIMIYLTLAVVSLTLPQKWTNWVILAGVGIALINLILEFYAPLTYRLEMPALPAGALIISGVLVLIYIGFIIRQFNNYSLRAKLIMAFVLVTLISVGTIVLVINRVIQHELTESVGTNLKEAAVSQSYVIGDLFATQIDILSSLAIRRIVVDNVKLSNGSYSNDPAAIQAEIDLLDKQWRAADAADNDAHRLVQSRVSNLLAAELRRLRELAPDHIEIFVTDQYGATVATTNRTSDYYQADEDWWQAAYNNGQGAVYLSQPVFDESSNAYAIIIALPLNDGPNGPIIGILRSTLRVTALTDALTTARFGQTADVDILLPSGHLLRSEGDIAPLEPDSLAQLQTLETIPYDEFIYDHELRLVSIAPVAVHDVKKQVVIDSLGWQLVADQGLAAALVSLDTIVQAGLLTGLGVMLLAGLLAVGLAHILTNPITRLTAAATQIAAGDLEIQTPVGAADETGMLARAFNTMTAQLRNVISSLEDQVRERTSDLVLSMKVGQRALTIRDMEELLPTITEFIREQFNLYYTQVYFVDDLGENLVLKVGTGTVGQELIARHHSLPIGSGSIVGRVAAEQKSIVVPDTQYSDLHKANPLLPQTRSELAVPLILNKQIIGVLDMQADKANTFTENNLAVFEAMATQLAISIDGAHQWAFAQEAQRKSEEIVKQLTRERWAEQLTSRGGKLSFAYDLSVVTPRSAAELEPGDGENKLAVPLIVQNESIGQLGVKVPPQRVLSSNEQNLLTAVAQQLAQKAENLRLFEQTQQRATREQVARQIVDKVRSSRDVETALKTAAEELSKALRTSRAVVSLRVENQPEQNEADRDATSG